MKLITFSLSCCVVFLWAALSVAEEKPAGRFEKIVQPLVQAINAEDYASIQRDFGKGMLEALPLVKLTPIFKNMMGQFGKIVKVDPPRLTSPNEAIFPAHFERAKLDIKVVLDEQDKITGLWFLPPTAAIPVPERNQTALHLPFTGEWFVLWGGETKELNKHHDAPNQRYAFDFLITDDAGKTRQGDGVHNEDYFAFGKPVLAPADGIVTDVINGVRDNTPGSMNPYSALGNAVIIEHREHEASVLAHFKQGSIRVRPGDPVKRGQVLGLCGNSGNSSEPHIHYHLQNTPVIQDGTGIRCLFDKVSVIRDGKTKSKMNYSPVRGDTVRQQ
jgi:murein DD-endopeptidase MepM/ murein hydrolase activator NlpD